MHNWKREVQSRLNNPVLARQPEVIEEELAQHVPEQRYHAWEPRRDARRRTPRPKPLAGWQSARTP